MNLEDALKEWDSLDMDEGLEPESTIVEQARRILNAVPMVHDGGIGSWHETDPDDPEIDGWLLIP